MFSNTYLNLMFYRSTCVQIDHRQLKLKIHIDDEFENDYACDAFHRTPTNKI